MTTAARTKTHQGRYGGAGWACSCGKNSDNTTGTMEEHQLKAAQSAYKRLDEVNAAVLLVSLGARDDMPARQLLQEPFGWAHSGRLRPYALPYYDSLGRLEAMVNWTAVLAAIDDGLLTDYSSPHGTEHSVFALRVAASMCGFGQVKLADLWRGKLSWPEQQAVREILDWTLEQE